MIKELTRRVLLLGMCTLLLVGCAIPPSQGSTPPALTTPLTLPPATTSPTSLPSSTDWTTYHRNNARTGLVENAPDPHQLTRAWNVQLDGAVYAEPLVVGGRVIVATEGDSLYALNRNTGQVQWRTNVGSPVPLSTLPCGNIDPLGITGTPVYDPATGLVFAVAEIQGPAHILVGVDVATGQVRVRRSVDIPAMEQQPRGSGITAIRCCACRRRCAWKTALHQPSGSRIMPQMLIWDRWDLSSCRED